MFQDKDLCDFEKWNKKKDVTGQKMGLRVEIQMNVQKAAKDYGVSDVLSLANGLMQAGVLLPNQRSSLETLLSAKHKQESRLNQFVKEHEFDQVWQT